MATGILHHPQSSCSLQLGSHSLSSCYLLLQLPHSISLKLIWVAHSVCTFFLIHALQSHALRVMLAATHDQDLQLSNPVCRSVVCLSVVCLSNCAVTHALDCAWSCKLLAASLCCCLIVCHNGPACSCIKHLDDPDLFEHLGQVIAVCKTRSTDLPAAWKALWHAASIQAPSSPCDTWAETARPCPDVVPNACR